MSSGDYIRTSFAKDFEPAGPGFVYRSLSDGPGIPVTADERRQMEADLDRGIRRFGVLANGWLLAGVALTPLGLLYLYSVHDLVKLAALLCILLLALVPHDRLRRDALKRVAGRTPVDGGLSWAETTLRRAAAQSWYRAVIFFLAPLTYLRHMADTHYDRPSAIVFATIAVLAAVGSGVDLSTKVWLALRQFVRT